MMMDSDGWHVTSDWLRDLPHRYKFPHESVDELRFLRTIYEKIHLVDALVEPGIREYIHGETWRKVYHDSGGICEY